MDLAAFTAELRHLSAGDLHQVSGTLDRRAESVAGEVEVWRATLTIERVLRQSHCGRTAAHAAAYAAADASHAVLGAAASEGIPLPDGEVTHVARAAAEVARGIVAGPGATGAVKALLADFSPVLTAA